MNELFTTIDSYIKKVATEAAEARFNEMMANKVLGLDDTSLRGKVDDLLETAVSDYVNDKLDLTAKISEAVDDYDYDDQISSKVRQLLRDTTLEVTIG